jgi:hypothetical protein
MTEHLGYEKPDPAGAGAGNIRNHVQPHANERLLVRRRSLELAAGRP